MLPFLFFEILSHAPSIQLAYILRLAIGRLVSRAKVNIGVEKKQKGAYERINDLRGLKTVIFCHATDQIFQRFALDNIHVMNVVLVTIPLCSGDSWRP